MKNTVLFDLDGTLINSLLDLADAANYAIEKFGCPKRSVEEIEKFVGNGADMLIKRALSENMKDKWEDALGIFKEYYNKNLHNKTTPYDGICDMLFKLKNKGYKLGVVTNKPDLAAKNICNFFFKDTIGAVVGADLEKRRKKPEPDSVDYCLEILNSKRENAIFVGDSDVDVATGKNAGIITIGVTWGFRGVECLEGADYIVDSVDMLYEIIGNK
ncbi:MAG: HAD family hydrolase [Lachnospirales bacterium]